MSPDRPDAPGKRSRSTGQPTPISVRGCLRSGNVAVRPSPQPPLPAGRSEADQVATSSSTPKLTGIAPQPRHRTGSPAPEPRETAQNFLIPGKLSEDLSCQRSQMAGTGWQSPQPAERPAAALVCQSLNRTRQSLRSSPPNLRGSLCASPTDRKPLPAPSASGTPSAASPTGTSP